MPDLPTGEEEEEAVTSKQIVLGSGHWSPKENTQFEKGCIMFGWGNWKMMVDNNVIPTRNYNQIKNYKRSISPDVKTRLDKMHQEYVDAKSKNKDTILDCDVVEEATGELEKKARNLVASLTQSSLVSVVTAVLCWDFKSNCLVDASNYNRENNPNATTFNNAVTTMNKMLSDLSDIALLMRKVGKPDEEISRFKHHDKYLPILDKKVRNVTTRATREICLKPVYDKESRTTCSAEEARQWCESFYEKLGFTNAKEMAAKGAEEAKQTEYFA